MGNFMSLFLLGFMHVFFGVLYISRFGHGAGYMRWCGGGGGVVGPEPHSHHSFITNFFVR